MAEVFENVEFLTDLDTSGRAVRSVVYCGGVVTLLVYEWARNGETVTERTVNYPAERIPQVLSQG